MKNKIKCLLLALLMTTLVSAPLLARRVSDGKYEFRALTEFEGETTGSLENIEEETAQSVLNTGDIFLGYDLNSTPPIMGFYYFDPADATATKMVPWKLLPKNRTNSNGTFILMSGFVFAPTDIPGAYFRDANMTGATTYDQYIVGRHYWNLSGDLTYSAGQSDYLIQTLHNGSMTNIFNFDSSANTLALGTTGTALSVGGVAVAPLASPTFTGTVGIPAPFTLGGTSVTATGDELNYLDIAALGTGAASKAVVLSATGGYTAPAGTWDLSSVTDINFRAGEIVLANLATDSVDYTKTTGSKKVLTPVYGTPSGWTWTGANMYGGTFVATGTSSKTLPAATAGMGFTVKVRGAFTPTIAPNTGGTIYLNGTSCGLNKSIVGSGLTTAMAVFQYSASVTWDVDAFGFTCVP